MSDQDAGVIVSLTTLGPAALPEVRRRRQGVRAALDRLEHAIAAPTTGREAAWVAKVADQLTNVETAFGHHVTVTEEEDGLFDEIIADAPRLANQVQQLRTDHLRIAVTIDRARLLATGPAAEGHLSELSEAALDLLARLTRHRHLGATLVYEAYTVDIEAAD
jgi:hypothetical protein